jgi:hypothetical protein
MSASQFPPSRSTDALVAQVVKYNGAKATITDNNRLVKYQPPKTEIWLEQRIWGHRFHNDQTPWLLVLEALNIMAAFASNQNFKLIFPGLDENHEGRTYEMPKRSNLRHLLFRDRGIDEIASSQTIGDASQWANWFDGIANGRERFGYLQQRFVNFGALRNAVTLLRGAEVESERHRRPTSRHLSPRGMDMLTADYGENRNDTVNKDRRFFARGGELLYLMLNRSRSRDGLEVAVRTRFISENSRWNKLALAMQSGVEEPGVSMDSFGFLPVAEHPAYDRVADDWVSLLVLDGLPDDSVPEPLMRLSGLGVLQYIVDRSADIIGDKRPPYPIDMLTPETANVQKHAKDAFAQHRELSRKAIRRLVQALVDSDEWKAALRQINPETALRKLCEDVFRYSPQKHTPEAMADEVTETAIDNHEQHLGRVVGFYAEQIGLAVARRGNGRWYAASDGFLEALVLANVAMPMELEAFLEKLWRRYSFVIGTEAARQEYPEANYEHFKANQRIFEDRLRVLGLSKRLSDDCAFVINPFHRHNGAAI